MTKTQLNVDSLQVTTFETVEAKDNSPEPVQRTGRTGYCNTCWGACDWTV
jgi:hypothetical protein